eukprot:2069019-Amphidinium_carterae.1
MFHAASAQSSDQPVPAKWRPRPRAFGELASRGSPTSEQRESTEADEDAERDTKQENTEEAGDTSYQSSVTGRCECVGTMR